ncbi:hypothetical protein VIGAN_02262200, partial [Vigna angularis var. angularis]
GIGVHGGESVQPSAEEVALAISFSTRFRPARASSKPSAELSRSRRRVVTSTWPLTSSSSAFWKILRSQSCSGKPVWRHRRF